MYMKTVQSQTLNSKSASSTGRTTAPQPVQRTLSSNSLPSTTLFHDIQLVDNQNSSSQPDIFNTMNPNINLNMNPNINQNINPALNSNINPNYDNLSSSSHNAPLVLNTEIPGPSTSFDSLIALMLQTMKNTQEEFRKELSTIRQSIAQISVAPPLNSNFTNSNTPVSNNNRISENSNRSYTNGDTNVKLEKWKIAYDGTKYDISELRHALTKEFGHLESDHEILLKISLRKQQYKENYDDFHSSIVSMNIRLQNPLPDNTLIDIIKRNINSNLRFLLFSTDARDLNEFRDQARKAEKVIRETKFPNPNTTQSRNIMLELFVLRTLVIIYVPMKSKSLSALINKCGQKGVLTPKCPNRHFQGNRKVGDLVTGDNRPSQQTPSLN
ncbi:hypothetical protein CVS40_8757 [Lucilia cuprina]|nr:hypothetical protein CVS40_8757 [Lucilia cuprina]